VRAFVTGGRGFVGGWLEKHLTESGDEVLVTDHDVDVTDAETVARAVRDFAPEAIYHLAGLANVAASWTDPSSFWRVNATGTLNVLEAARACDRVPTVLVVASAEVYGAVTPDELPLTEESPLRPASPYAVSKVAADYLAYQAYLGHKVPTIRARAFNHVGPGQAGSFLITDIARQVAELARTGGDTLRVGNLTSRRDFTDVRDVVRAYRLLVERGEPGEAYNVCSGRDVVVEDIVRRILELGGLPGGRLEVDESLLRPVDIPVLRGDRSKITGAADRSRPDPHRRPRPVPRRAQLTPHR
jgi:GDP-4-dehydro-6-deoxy-D-mannose reductase